MPRQVPPDLTLDALKKEAKRWLKALRANDADARARFTRAMPTAPTSPTLRDVHLAIAREFGFAGWMDVRQMLASRVTAAAGGSEPVPPALIARFLDNACPDHHVRSGSDHLRATYTAMRLLRQYPGIARASFYTAVVCGELDEVIRMLKADPGWASRADGTPGVRAGVGGENDLVKKDWGTKGWEPLSYLCFTRLPLPAVADNAVAIARLLLDHGANPNVSFQAGGSSYTPLTGVIGGGEEGRPAHQRRDELTGLLLDRGANPYDEQVNYNTHFNRQTLWFLQTIYEHARRTGRERDWADPEWTMLSAGGYGTGARWHLDEAVEHNDVALAKWCLTHGANPNAVPGRQRRDRPHSLYDEAMLRGHAELAELLVQHGAVRTRLELTPIQALAAACVRSDLRAIREAMAPHPKFLRASEPLFAATRHNRVDAAELLLDLGTSPNVESKQGERALHIAAYNDSVDVAALLIARGADVDPIGRQYQNTPLGGAMHMQSARMIDLLARVSKSAWEVGYAGYVDRLRELLNEKPARARGYDGETLLMYLPPDDEDKAMEVAQLLLDHGADPTIRDPDGATAADRAERNAMFRVAALLRDREQA